MDHTLALVEKFVSVQGEGANVGRAAVFLRLSGCNLDCVFADGAVCDTPWRKAREKTTVRDVVKWAVDVVTSRLERAGTIEYGAFICDAPEPPMVIITGGEPTIAPGFDALVDGLRRVGFYVAVESNGTRWRPSLDGVDWLVVSPKTAISHARDVDPEPDPRVLETAHEFRYVITGPDDPVPPMHRPLSARHFVSPAVEADGSGLESVRGIVPRFVPGAVERCMEITWGDPRWRISLQSQKWMMVR